MSNVKYQISNDWKFQNGFSPLLILLPLALIFVMTVVFVQQGRLFPGSPQPTPGLTGEIPELDDESCNDPYNADCYVGDDEGDDVRPEDLLGPD